MRAQCPELETLAAYVEGALARVDRTAVETHFADCRVCRETVALVIKTEAEMSSVERI